MEFITLFLSRKQIIFTIKIFILIKISYMSFYNKYILPKLLDYVMRSKDMEKHRLDVICEAKGVVLEIGFGSGLNISYYTGIVKLYALEPYQDFYSLAESRIKKVNFPIEHLRSSAEKIPLQDNSVDSVVSTWSLCSVPHPEIALSEIKRVLKPGGIFTFIEHGHSPKTFISQVQNILTPVWKHITAGCHLNRRIDILIEKSGLKIQKLKIFQQKSGSLVFMYKGLAVAKN